MSPNQWVFLITILATVIAEGRSADEIDLLAVSFTQLGDTLATISAKLGLKDNRIKTDSSVAAISTQTL